MSETTKEFKSSYGDIIAKFNELNRKYNDILGAEAFYGAFARAGMNYANQPQIQNARVKAISTLPADYTKDDIGAFLRAPYQHEKELRQTSETLRFTAYPYFKIAKTYADIPTYKHYIKPLYAEDVTTKDFLREATLLDKFAKALRPEIICHRIAGQAVMQGKVFYVLRTAIDRSHNKVEYAFMQQLPTDWCTIIGYNNVSGYTISFNMMYFLQPGTDYRQFGNLFEPYLDDFSAMFEKPKAKDERFVYASDGGISVNERLTFYPSNAKRNATGNPRVEYAQNGRWAYWVSLPIDRVWTFEIDDTTPAVVSPLAGLMLTYAQQADYEAAQLSLILNPLIKIFTGEIPYFDNNGTMKEDAYQLSNGGRALFEALFDALMAGHNTGGTAFFTAPVNNIKSHDFNESANANDVSSSFNKYAGTKAGLAAIIPVDDDIKAGQVQASVDLESRYTFPVLRQFERMIDTFIKSLNLKYEWEFKFVGDIYHEKDLRESALKAIANGDISAHYILSALDGESWIDKLTMMKSVKESGLLDYLIPPVTSYTMKQETSNLPPQGRPKSEGISESKEKAVDAGVVVG